MSGLVIRGLSVGYGRRQVLTQFDLTVAPGQIVALLGANGSGKTTLLRAISGELRPTAGEISVGGVSLATLDTRRRAALVAAMVQELTAEPGLSGLERIELSLYPRKGLFGRLTAEERTEIEAMAEEFGIAHLLSRDLAAMSAGERQMILLLGAACRRAPVLLLDEPTSALDFHHTEELFAFLHRLAGQGQAILAVLHDPTQAMRHADAIVCLANGEAEHIEVRRAETAALETALRRLYPQLKIHRDPLFCYTERKGKEDTSC